MLGGVQHKMASIGSPYVLTDADVRSGIQAVSQRLLGDVSDWKTLVSINSLAPPYFTFDPVKAFGLALDTQSVPSSLSSGATQISLVTQPQLWIAGNNVVFAKSSSNGIVTEAQTIVSYDGRVLAWGNGLRNSYPTGSYLATFPIQVFQSKVLMPGQILYLPTTQTNSFVVSQSGSTTNVFGTDAQDPISWENGDIGMVSGTSVLMQRIRCVLGTEIYSLPQAPLFGQRLRLLVGANVNSVDWTVFVREALLRLSEISQVTDLSISQGKNQIFISGKVYVYTSKTPLELVNEPFTLPILK